MKIIGKAIIFVGKAILTTLFHNKDNRTATVEKGILQISGQALIYTKTNDNYSVS